MSNPREGGIRPLLAPRRGAVALLAATSVAGGVFEAALLIVVTRSAFAITDGKDTFGIIAGWDVTVTTAVIIALALVVLRVALAIWSSWQSASLASTVVAGIRTDLAGAFLSAQWSAQHGERAGRLQELLTTFVNRGAELVGAVTTLITSGFTLAAMLVIAVAVDPAAALIVIAAIGVLGMVLRPIRNAVRGQARRTSAAGMEFATALSEVSHLGMEMHVFRVQDIARSRLDALIDHNRVTTRKLGLLQGVVPAVYSGLAYAALVGALAVAAALDSASLTSVGAVMLLMLRSLSYGQGVQMAITSINGTLPFLGSLEDELARYRAARLVDHGQPIGSVGTIIFDDVSFEYAAGTPVLRHVDATIHPHEVIGIVGPSGSGKSTLVQLLLGLRDPSSGTVLADARDIRVLSRQEWARRVTFVPQQPRLVAGTVADNIRFFRDDVTDEEIERASRLANLHDDVVGWPERYERQVGEEGSHLSGGQQQRLVIARALVERPDVLVLDEPTSALDVRSEALIRQTLHDLRDEMTIIIIAHRLSTLDICDRIMVVQDGEMRAFDTPEHLASDNEFYRDALRLSGLH